MKRAVLTSETDFAEWRGLARGLLMTGTPPHEVRWEVGSADMFAVQNEAPEITHRAVGVVPKRFVELARIALFHKDPLRFALLYRVLFRLQKDNTLLGLRSDPDVSRLYKLVADLREQTTTRSGRTGR